jgi:hypothetical protein
MLRLELAGQSEINRFTHAFFLYHTYLRVLQVHVLIARAFFIQLFRTT